MVISLALIGIGAIGLVASFANGAGAGLLFFVCYVGAMMVVSWIMTFKARRQDNILVDAPAEAITATIESSFAGLGWKKVDGPGVFNFRARGFGLGGYGKERPVISIAFEDMEDGTTGVGIWTSSWNSQAGIMAFCDRVVEKKFRLSRELLALSEPVDVPSPPNPIAAEPTFTQSPGGAGAGQEHRKSASTDPQVTLSDPVRPADDLTQKGYQLFKACGLTALSWAEMPLEQHSRLLFNRLPVFHTTVVNPAGGGALGGRDDGIWMGYEGPRGSVISYHAFPDGDSDFLFDNVTSLLPTIPDPLNWGIGTVGAKVPAGVARILSDGHAVPLWQLSSFAGQRRSQGPDVPVGLRAGLLVHGWNALDDNGFKIDVPLGRGGTQAAFFAARGAESFALMVPLCDSDGGALPPWIHGRATGHYELDVVADTVVLCERYESGQPNLSPGAITDAARALVTYSDSQFSSPPTVHEPTPEPPMFAAPGRPPRQHDDRRPAPRGGPLGAAITSTESPFPRRQPPPSWARPPADPATNRFPAAEPRTTRFPVSEPPTGRIPGADSQTSAFHVQQTRLHPSRSDHRADEQTRHIWIQRDGSARDDAN
ncbi:hypothetical protein [Mycolicibacterium sp. F2034L]|uniref:hypothetical protein n=1 Tax=Mycolicibacterium sp. F2034L TaxID=2926422 RepID=UPI001FF4B288|nr:hypothetical protein [Mycolicibacterium sp. F2034L]MCK0177620.1 hypothetical protein [Mycolicibacterium sp. F2034L]